MWKNKKSRSKSYYKKFFSNFLIVLLVPMLTIVMIFLTAQSIVKEQIVMASKNTLNQFFRNVDNILAEGQEICVTIANDSKCSLLVPSVSADFKRRTYVGYEIQQMLGNFRSEKYADIFVYFPGVDYVISGVHAAGTLEFYQEAYYDNKDISYEELQTVVEYPKGKPVIMNVNGKQEGSYLCITMKQNQSKNEYYNYVVVIMLSPSYIETLMHGVEGDSQIGVSMIFDASKQLLRYTGDSEGMFHLEGYNEAENLYNESFGKDKYIMQVRPSDTLDAYYAYAVPQAYFWKKLFFLYMVCGLGVVATVILGIWVARRQAKKTYEPLGKLVDDLQKPGKKQYDVKAHTEFEFIEELFKEEGETNLALNKVIRKDEKKKRDNFIFSILNGNVNVSGEEEDCFAENGMSLCSDCFCVALLRVEQPCNVEKELTSFAVFNIFEELCNREYRGYVVALRELEYVLLVNLYTEEDKEALRLLLEEGKNFFSQKCGMGLTMGVSTVQAGISGIPLAYEEAKHALEYRFLLGTELIIDYADISTREFKYLQTSEMKVLHVVMDYLTDGEEDTEAIWIIDDLLDDYRIDRDASLEAVECFRIEVITSLHRILIQEGDWTQEWKERVMKLSNRNSLEDFKQYFADILKELYYKKRVKATEENVCGKVMEYIEQHYGEEQLSRTLLGELFEIAPGYLSTLFKEKYRFTIPEYIALTRINHAKEQLRDTEDTIQEIASQNGYVNSNSFTRAFKRQEGITRSAYRELFRNE